MNPNGETEKTQSVPPATPAPRRQRAQRKRQGKTGSFSGRDDTPAVKNPQTSTGFGDGYKALEKFGLGISGRTESVYSAPKTDGYFQLVDQCWDQLIALKPEVQSIMTRGAWQHVHALFLYRRISDIEFAATGKRTPPPTRIPLPYETSVFQPIWAILSDIGIVDDPDLRVKYIPIADFPGAEKPTESDFVKILGCTQYDWESSWEQVLADRATLDSALVRERHTDRVTTVSSDPTDRSKLTERVAVILADLTALAALEPAKFLAYEPESEDIFLNDELDPKYFTLQWDSIDVNVKTKAECDDVKKQLFARIREIKSGALIHSYPAFSQETVQFQFQNESIPTDPGTYGAWLHWDPRLFSDYSRAVDVLRPLALFSPSFPKETKGTYMWVLSREKNNSGFFVRMPKVEISAPIWLLGLILDMGNLSEARRSAWYVHSDITETMFIMKNDYIKSAIKSGVPIERFR